MESRKGVEHAHIAGRGLNTPGLWPCILTIRSKLNSLESAGLNPRRFRFKGLREDAGRPGNGLRGRGRKLGVRFGQSRPQTRYKAGNVGLRRGRWIRDGRRRDLVARRGGSKLIRAT